LGEACHRGGSAQDQTLVNITRTAGSLAYGSAMPRRFPPPWSIEEGAACFIIRDHDKQALAYVYYENESGRRSSAKLLTRDEALSARLKR
jgi:hypothetical protein